MAEKQTRYSRLTTVVFWLLLVGIIISLLIYFNQIAILYVLATVFLVVLLLIVSFSDLEKVGRDDAEGLSPKV